MSCFSERKYTTAWPVELITIKLYLPLLFLIFSFSIQFYGECWSGATAPLTYDRYGRSLHCTSEVGGMHANLVYRFVGEGQWGCLFIIFFLLLCVSFRHRNRDWWRWFKLAFSVSICYDYLYLAFQPIIHTCIDGYEEIAAKHRYTKCSFHRLTANGRGFSQREKTGSPTNILKRLVKKFT